MLLAVVPHCSLCGCSSQTPYHGSLMTESLQTLFYYSSSLIPYPLLMVPSSLIPHPLFMDPSSLILHPLIMDSSSLMLHLRLHGADIEGITT